ncbi:helix-hairpin-helix domain-containing protein [Candidatus Palauibacter sp.]|uniref:helix-hairpin-helix domain-containing protein n=1 Tax=Candidatus Palauibacter sp. TaxID=3101350 RepID=UPI003AF27CDA
MNPAETDIAKLQKLQRIPGVGPSIARDLAGLGIGRLRDLEGRDPNELYARLCSGRGQHIDRCVLYVFRCAVYFAETERPEPDLLKWWNWKDRLHVNERGRTPA